MPNWQPNWVDVQFDYQAAYEAISSCYGCIAFLESRGEALGPPTQRATREWRGRHRDEFEVQHARLERIAQDLIAQLRAIIRSTQLEIEAAQAEQHRRVAERLRWEQEEREERARAEQARRSCQLSPAGSASAGPSASGTFNDDGVMVLSRR